jgi:ribose 1,5-bisphosphokinase
VTRPGLPVAVVGPSGAGKDSLIAALVARRPGLIAVRRVVTRPARPGDEPFEPATPAAFARRVAAGGFVLHWQAHGLHYGIPAGVEADLAAGRDCVMNLSRGVLAEAAARWPRLRVVAVTARPEVLAQRLAARGREDAAAVARRLARAGAIALPAGLDVVQVDNSGTLEAAVAAALAALWPAG